MRRAQVSELPTFFLNLPKAVLLRYAQLYLREDGDEESYNGDKLSAKETSSCAERLAALYSDRHWVRSRLREMPRTQHVALIALLQSNNVAGGTWLLQELTQSHGMSEDLWAEVICVFLGTAFSSMVSTLKALILSLSWHSRISDLTSAN